MRNKRDCDLNLNIRIDYTKFGGVKIVPESRINANIWVGLKYL